MKEYRYKRKGRGAALRAVWAWLCSGLMHMGSGLLMHMGSGLLLTSGSLLLAGCSDYDGDAAIGLDDGKGVTESYIKQAAGVFEAQWLTGRTVVDTTTLTAFTDHTLLVNRVPEHWLAEQFLPNLAHAGQWRGVQPFLLSYNPIGYSENNSYLASFSMQQVHTEQIQGLFVVRPDGYEQALMVAIATAENHAPTEAELRASKDSIFVRDESYTLSLYLNQMESAGVYDQQNDAWTLKLVLDSIGVEHRQTKYKWHGLGETGSTEMVAQDRIYNGRRLLPAESLSLLTTRRKN